MVTKWQSKASLTKFKALMADLSKLREEEPNMRAVVFTQHDLVQERLVTLINGETGSDGLLKTPKGAKPLKVFEFNKHTPPTKRHKLIKDFQDANLAGPRLHRDLCDGGCRHHPYRCQPRLPHGAIDRSGH